MRGGLRRLMSLRGLRVVKGGFVELDLFRHIQDSRVAHGQIVVLPVLQGPQLKKARVGGREGYVVVPIDKVVGEHLKLE